MRPHGDVDRAQVFADNVIIIGKYMPTRIYVAFNRFISFFK